MLGAFIPSFETLQLSLHKMDKESAVEKIPLSLSTLTSLVSLLPLSVAVFSVYTVCSAADKLVHTIAIS